MNCSSCGAILRPNTRFCGVCGAPVKDAPPDVPKAAPTYCINCGGQLQEGDLFCDRCGARQDGVPAEPTYPQGPAGGLDSPLSAPRVKEGRNPLLIVGGIAGAAILLLVAGFLFLNRGSGNDGKVPASPSAAPTAGQTIAYSPTQHSGGAAVTPSTVTASGVQSQGAESAQAAATSTAQAAASVSRAATSTAQAVASSTAVARTQATATVQARAQATATVQAQATAQVRATAQAIDSEAAAMAQGARKLPTVLRGALEYRQDGKLSKQRWGVNLLNLVVEGRFFNPYDRQTRAWDYGLTLREGKTGQFRLSIHSDTEWYLRIEDWSSGKSTFETVGKGHIPWMEVNPDGSNVLKVIVKGANGMFFLNSRLVDRLNLSAHQENGDVGVAANFLASSGIAGKSTRFEGFDLYELK